MLEPFLGKSRFAQHGERIVAGQRMMQAAADIMLGWERIEAIDGETKDFYIRQLWDAKGSAEVELMNPPASAHTERSAAGPSPEPTPARATPSRSPPTSAQETRSTSAMAAFSETYADQNERDYQALLHAAKTNRVAVEYGL